MKEPQISVGILHADNIRFSFNAPYVVGAESVSGEEQVSLNNGQICWRGNVYDELIFEPKEASASFCLYDVVIGINFHWERKENQTFQGTLKFIIDEGTLCAVNVLGVEDYLKCVISSEMSATASLEFLKAHAVISRSWVLAQVNRFAFRDERLETNDDNESKANNSEVSQPSTLNPQLFVKWYDHDAHKNFDVCADDHCQRYQGITRIKSQTALDAVEATRGQVLMYGDEICDARFSKCCGGMMEEFQNCWEDSPKPYLIAKRDAIGDSGDFCDTNDKSILSQVLNGYDQETADFYRWTVKYTTEEISELVCRKSGIDFGTITDLVPVKRGPSGRLILLKIVGTKNTITVGKELEIRKWLSESHLYSSAFDVEKTSDGFVLHGKGWGHGVGLCQIGAAVMGSKGYRYDGILMHYYPNSEIKRIYDQQA